jgi:hypothetical protein
MERYAIIENDYVLFENGVVLSLKTNKFINGYIHNTGYIRIQLNGHQHRIHRLLAKAFIDNPDNKPCIDHIDRNRSNNDLSNLRWCSIMENTHNRSISRNNLSGENCIHKTHRTHKKGLKFYWVVYIESNHKTYRKIFRCDESDIEIPQNVIQYRNDMKRKLHGEFSSLPPTIVSNTFST